MRKLFYILITLFCILASWYGFHREYIKPASGEVEYLLTDYKSIEVGYGYDKEQGYYYREVINY